MDRASDSGSEGWGFESLLAYQKPRVFPLVFLFAFQKSYAGACIFGKGQPQSNMPPACSLCGYFRRTKNQGVSPWFFFSPSKNPTLALAFLGRDSHSRTCPRHVLCVATSGVPKTKGFPLVFVLPSKICAATSGVPLRRKLHIACDGAFCAIGALVPQLLLSKSKPAALDFDLVCAC